MSTNSNTPSNALINVLVVGAGLSGGLTALRFKLAKPELRVTLLEEAKSIEGQLTHTWGFHDSDLPPGSREWLQSFISRTWENHSVAFPRFNREINGGYHAIRSADFARALKSTLKSDLRLGSKAIRLTSNSVTLESGETLRADLVVDARGQLLPSKHAGFQKFLAFDVETSEPHGLQAPILIDAICPQLDGFRYFCLYPWDETHVLIQENYYSDSPTLNDARISRSLESYAERKGWKIKKIERKERGILPVPLTAEYIPTSVEGEPLPIGTRGGFFHATTGHSLPEAVRMAEFLTSLPETTTAAARASLLKYRKPFLSRQRFYRLLNRMIFMASEPTLRYLVMQKFYEQPVDIVERFYSGRTSWTDRVRILTGHTPLPFAKLIRSLSEKSVVSRGTGVDSGMSVVPTAPAPQAEPTTDPLNAKSPSERASKTQVAPADRVASNEVHSSSPDKEAQSPDGSGKRKKKASRSKSKLREKHTEGKM